MIRSTTYGVTLAVCLLAARTASAQEPTYATAAPGYHTHDGFLLRLTPGLSGAFSSTEDAGVDVELSGGGATLGVAVGFAVSPRFVITGELATHLTTGPTLTVGDTEYTSDDDVEWTVNFFGVGGSLYLPSNFYLHGAIGGMKMGIQGPSDDKPDYTDTGVGVNLMMGQEWWVSDNWGIGIAGQMLAGSVPDGQDDWATVTLALLLSATYN